MNSERRHYLQTLPHMEAAKPHTGVSHFRISLQPPQNRITR
jgi:hypothetical protein